MHLSCGETCTGDDRSHSPCGKEQAFHANTQQPAFPSCHHLLHISSSVLFLAPALGGKHWDQTSGHMRNESGTLCRSGSRPPGLLRCLRRIKHLAFVTPTSPLFLSFFFFFTVGPTPWSLCGKTLKRHLHTAETKTQVLLVLSNNSPA